MGSSPVPADQAARAKRRILVATSLVTSLIMLDSNIVAVSLPSIARALGAGFADIEWVTYVLSFTALLLAAGSYADRHGRKRTTLIGLVVFAVASGLCGLAQSALMLDLARALQGVGASLLLPAALAIINHAFAKQDRAQAYAIWGAYVGIAIAGGPIVGGVAVPENLTQVIFIEVKHGNYFVGTISAIQIERNGVVQKGAEAVRKRGSHRLRIRIPFHTPVPGSPLGTSLCLIRARLAV